MSSPLEPIQFTPQFYTDGSALIIRGLRLSAKGKLGIHGKPVMICLYRYGKDLELVPFNEQMDFVPAILHQVAQLAAQTLQQAGKYSPDGELMGCSLNYSNMSQQLSVAFPSEEEEEDEVIQPLAAEDANLKGFANTIYELLSSPVAQYNQNENASFMHLARLAPPIDSVALSEKDLEEEEPSSSQKRKPFLSPKEKEVAEHAINPMSQNLEKGSSASQSPSSNREEVSGVTEAIEPVKLTGTTKKQGTIAEISHRDLIHWARNKGNREYAEKRPLLERAHAAFQREPNEAEEGVRDWMIGICRAAKQFYLRNQSLKDEEERSLDEWATDRACQLIVYSIQGFTKSDAWIKFLKEKVKGSIWNRIGWNS